MITLAQADTIVKDALRHSREQQFPPMTIAVLDAAANMVSFAREDHATLLRERIARGKATGALNMGVGSRTLAKRAELHPAFIASLQALGAGTLIPVAGGVLIRDGAGLIIGAVGVSGHLPDHDEEAAVAGITAAGLTADPGE